MKILIFGATGLIGLPILTALAKSTYEVECVYRNSSFDDYFARLGIKVYKVTNIEDRFINSLLCCGKYDFVINCLGITKHNKLGSDLSELLYWNIDFPRLLDNLSQKIGFNLIHISTDCVFDGKDGNYSESYYPNATDAYGITKGIADIVLKNAMILRTSTIGDHPTDTSGLFNWFKYQKSCSGFYNAIFSGMINTYFAEKIIIEDILSKNYFSKGVYHIAAEPINKYALLHLLNSKFEYDITIHKDGSLNVNRSLNAEKYYKLSGRKPVKWNVMMHEFKKGSKYYDW